MRTQTLKEDVARRVREANARIEQERNRLAALMSELAQSVVMCNVEGRILLYNARAMQLLSKPLDGAAAAGKAHSLVGLGRSIFGVFDRNLIIHALETIHERLAQGARGAAANFVTTAPSGLLVRVQMAPVFGAAGDAAADRRSRRHHRVRAGPRQHHAPHRIGQSPRSAAADADAGDAGLARQRARGGRDDRGLSRHGQGRAGPVHRHHRRGSAAADREARRHRRRVCRFDAHRMAARRHARRRPDRRGAAPDRKPARNSHQAGSGRRSRSGSTSTATR